MFDNIGQAVYNPGIINPSVPGNVFMVFDDFVKTPEAVDYTLTQASTGAMALSTGADCGVLELDSGSTTVTQGANLQMVTANFTPKAGRTINYATRIKVVDTYDKAELFIGLAEIDTTIIATSAVSTENHIGFSCVTDNGVLLANCEKATAGTTTTGTTIAEDTWVKLGFRVNGVTSVEFFVDDVKVSEIATTANIPVVALAPSFVCQSGGTNDPILHIDYILCQQDR